MMEPRSAAEWEEFYGQKFQARVAAARGRRWGIRPGGDGLKVGDVCQLRGDYRLYPHKVVRVRTIEVDRDGYLLVGLAFLGPNVVSRDPSPVDEDGFADTPTCYATPNSLRRI